MREFDIRLTKNEKGFVLLCLFVLLIYSLVVAVIIFLSTWDPLMKFYVVLGYAILFPLLLYFTWFFLVHQKLKRWPPEQDLLGGKLTYLGFFFLMGICVITWAIYWNDFIDIYWSGAAEVYYVQTGDEIGSEVIFLIGSRAINPALIEEFLKAFPLILAFFVVLRKERDPQEKGRGMLGNELGGMMVGIMIGIAFQVLELIAYILIAVEYGTFFHIFLQVTRRGWTPIHILGGAISGYAIGRAERLRFEKGEEDLSLEIQVKKFIKRFLPLWLLAVIIHFSLNGILILTSISHFYYGINFEVVSYIMGLIYITLIFFLIIWLLERANKTSLQANRCPNTGIYTLQKNRICNPIAEKRQQDRKNRSIEKISVCRFLKISFIYGIIFAIFSCIFLVFSLWKGILGIISGLSIIISSLSLLKMKHYSGKRNVYSWMLLIFNYIGLMVAIPLAGIGLIILSVGINSTFGVAIGIGIIITGFIIVVLPFLYFFKNGGPSYFFQYQEY